MRTILTVVCIFSSIALAAQGPVPAPGGANLPGPAIQRPQPGMPARDNPATAPVGTGKILGRVTAADTGAPLRRAQVRITAAEQRVVKTATTDTDGKYQFVELPAGRFTVSVTRNGYVSLSFGQQRPFEPGKQLDLIDGQVAEKIDFALPRGGVISGRITDETGEPLAGVGVRAMRYQYQPDGTRRLVPSGMGMPFGIQTDDLGQFRVYGLMPGAYIVSASINPMGGASVMPLPGGGMVTTLGPNDGSDGYSTTYYPGTSNESEAQNVLVNIGQEASAFFSMAPARLANISGVIRNSQGRPAANVNLTFRPQQPTMGAGGFFGGMTGADGSFVMQNVPPGDYMIDVRPQMGRPQLSAVAGTAAAEPEFASVPVSVAGQNVTGLVITTGRGVTISGRVIFDKVNPELPAPPMIGQRPPTVMFSTTDPSMSMGLGMIADNGVIDADGRFELKGINGRGTLSVMGTASAVKLVTVDGVPITDTPHEFKGTTGGIEITLTNAVTTLTGSVTAAGRGAIKDYVVAVLPANLRDGESPRRFIRATRPDQDGKFIIKGLPAGDYFAAAVESLEQGGQWDPAFQDLVKPRATRFRLNEGQNLAIELRLIQ